MSKIVLINHKYNIPIDDPCIYPLGFMYVSTFLKSVGNEVKVLNYNLWDYDFEKEIQGYDIAGFTGFEEFKGGILADEKVCIKNGLKTMVGGALSTFNAIPEFKGLRVIGELPGPFVDFYNNNYPDYDGFGIDEYHKRHNVRYMGVLTTLGCPYECTFCAQTCVFRMRDLASVFNEIDYYIAKYKCELIVFNDNTLNINKKRFLKICEGMKERGVQWSAAIRCAPFDEEMVTAAKESGCKGFVVGVESFDQKNLDKMNKKIKVRQIIRTLDLLEKHNVNYYGNALVGFDGETVTDIFQGLSLIPSKYKIFPVLVQPFVGTKDGRERSITKDEYGKLNNTFNSYIEKAGKYCYPTQNNAN